MDVAEQVAVDQQRRAADPVGGRELVAGEAQTGLVRPLEVDEVRLLADDRGVDVPVDEQRVVEIVGAVVVVVVELGDEPGVGGVEPDVEALAQRHVLGEVDDPTASRHARAAVDVGRSKRSELVSTIRSASTSRCRAKVVSRWSRNWRTGWSPPARHRGVRQRLAYAGATEQFVDPVTVRVSGQHGAVTAVGDPVAMSGRRAAARRPTGRPPRVSTVTTASPSSSSIARDGVDTTGVRQASNSNTRREHIVGDVLTELTLRKQAYRRYA